MVTKKAFHLKVMLKNALFYFHLECFQSITRGLWIAWSYCLSNRVLIWNFNLMKFYYENVKFQTEFVLVISRLSFFICICFFFRLEALYSKVEEGSSTLSKNRNSYMMGLAKDFYLSLTSIVSIFKYLLSSKHMLQLIFY